MATNNKSYFVIMLLLLMTSCSQNNNTQPEIELINNEVFYADTKKDIRYIHCYNNTKQRVEATNLITFKISNPTNNKILLNISESLWHPMDSKIEKSKHPGMFFIVKDSNSIAKVSMPMISFLDESFSEVALEMIVFNDSIKKMKYELMNIYHSGFPLGNLEIIDDFFKNSVVLNPNETRTFYFLLKLPIIREINLKAGEYDFIYIEEINKFNKFQLYYSADAAYLKSILPQYLLKELEENQIEIFDGVLMSNEVPLVKR